MPVWEGQIQGKGFNVYSAPVDYNFIDFFDISIIEGRDFSREIITDSEKAFIINETAVKEIGWEDPIGKKFSNWLNQDGRVIGVFKDFHNNSIRMKVEPLALVVTTQSRNSSLYAVKVQSENVQDVIEFLENTLTKFDPTYPFSYSFLDERIDSMYRVDQKVGEIFNYFTALALVISCMGLLGLISFIAVQKTKEIGIRKVLGSKISSIVYLISKDFMVLVFIANLIAWPAAYYAMSIWLQNFAYRISIDWWIFVVAGMAALVIALMTVSFHSLKAARANPVDSLRSE